MGYKDSMLSALRPVVFTKEGKKERIGAVIHFDGGTKTPPLIHSFSSRLSGGEALIARRPLFSPHLDKSASLAAIHHVDPSAAHSSVRRGGPRAADCRE